MARNSGSVGGRGPDHLILFKNLVRGRWKVREKLGVIWVLAIYSIWKARNAIVFKLKGFVW
jgi:hypothetical protein